MSDLRSRLERIGDRAQPASDAFERLERTRRRRERNRRIGAGVVAFVIAIGGTVAVVSAFRGGDEPTIGDDGLEAFGVIWPETTYEDAFAVQKDAGAGDPSLAWRLDAFETARAFGRDALGWDEASLEVEFGDATTAVLSVPPASCETPPETGCRGLETTIELRQLFGSDGIWSVASAQSDEFLEVPGVGAEIVLGEDLVIPTELPPSTNVYVAWVGLGACAGWEHDVITSGEEGVSLTAPEVPEGHPAGCEAVLVVLNNDEADHGIEGLGEQLLRYGYRTALYGVLAVPVLLVPEGFDPVPDVANVKCVGPEIVVDTPIVRAQPDGVHLMLTGAEDTSFTMIADPQDGGSAEGDTPVSRGEGLGEETPTAVIMAQAPPGRYLLRCSATSAPDIVGTTRLEVVDPAGHYLPSEPECLGEVYGMAPGYAEGTLGDQGDPVDVARGRLTGLEEGDIVERAGYAEGAAEPVVRIVRDGTVVGSVSLFDDGQGGWLLSSLEGCSGTAFGWSDGNEDPGVLVATDCESGNVIELSVVPLEFRLVFANFEFDLDCVRVPAGEPFTIHFENRVPGTPSNVSIYPEGSDEAVFRGDICNGPGGLTYEVPALEPGTYRFVDDVHPTMAEGVLLVE